jgi:hypothetical protein
MPRRRSRTRLEILLQLEHRLWRVCGLRRFAVKNSTNRIEARVPAAATSFGNSGDLDWDELGHAPAAPCCTFAARVSASVSYLAIS